MNIHTVGARFFADQISRIDQGLIELGYNVNSFLGPPDFIYSNDASNYDVAIGKWLNWDKEPKLILNVLDCPAFLPEWNSIHDKLVGQLGCANKVTCISKTVQKDIKDYFDIDAAVIYNPIKPVYYISDLKRDIPFLFVGRALSPNKRVIEILRPLYDALVPYWGKDCIQFVGSENPQFGKYLGIVSDEQLNLIYNRSIFGLISSAQEGLNLPLIEMLCTNVKPIVCRDMATASEFSPAEFLCDPTPEAMFSKAKEIGANLPKYDAICEEYARKYSEQFSPKSVAQNIISVYNQI